ncbi:unnamed protein product [Diamesa hyperborea]
MNSKFRGSLLGVIVGDCCGAAFEGEVIDAGKKLVLRNFLNKLEGPYFRAPAQRYTDDTAMTKTVAKALLNYDNNYQKELAVNFVKEYFKEPKRGYGSGVIEVFHKLRAHKFEELLIPAKEQYNGKGSFGNGAAMRISPVALFCYNKSQKVLEDLVVKTSSVTHSNIIGTNGAILQALAIQQNLSLDCNTPLDVNKYISDLLKKLSSVEPEEDEFGIKDIRPYTIQLTEIGKLLNKEFQPSIEEVVNLLGHSVNALYSVPTAIYCFLRNSESNSNDNLTPFRRTLEYSISLGGDTDTIASMALALSGAYYGDSIIPENLIKHCEGSDEVISLADQLYKVASNEQ